MSTITVPDSLKMIRETLCIAQAGVVDRVYDVDRKREHLDRISRMIEDIDRQRPLGPDGKHGDRHTETCGCQAGLPTGEIGELVFGSSQELAPVRVWANACIGTIDRFTSSVDPNTQKGYRQAMEDLIEILDLWESERSERS